MRVYIDGFIYAHSPNGGVARYVTKLISHLSEEISPEILALDSILEGPFQPHHSRLRLKSIPRFSFRPGRLAYFVEPWRAKFARWRSRADIFHPSYFETLERTPPKGTPLVITCHDMAHERFSNELDRDGRWSIAKANAFERAAAIICVSERTKADLESIYPAMANKAFVVPLGADSLPYPKCGSLRRNSQLLFVGGRNGYKQFDFALKILQELHRMGLKNMRLHVAGAPLSNSERSIISELGVLGSVKVHPYPSDDQLSQLYQQSLMLIYPSLWEGFGLPPVEAANMGCITLAREQTTIQDTLADGGLYGSGAFASDWAEIIRHAVGSPDFLASLRTKAHVRAKSFTWEKTAQMTEAVYHSLV